MKKARYFKPHVWAGFFVWTVMVVSTGGCTTVSEEVKPAACDDFYGCSVKIADVRRAGDELEVSFETNFAADLSGNHFHVWWGENYNVKQIGRNARAVHGVQQGQWLEYAAPVLVTTGAVSMRERGVAQWLCVSAADRDHNLINATLYHCKKLSDYF